MPLAELILTLIGRLPDIREPETGTERAHQDGVAATGQFCCVICERKALGQCSISEVTMPPGIPEETCSLQHQHRILR